MLAQFLTARLSTAIQQVNYPVHTGKPNPAHGKFFIVGSIPAACYDRERGGSFFYDTEDECAQAIEATGVTRYQLANCQWNK